MAHPQIKRPDPAPRSAVTWVAAKLPIAGAGALLDSADIFTTRCAKKASSLARSAQSVAAECAANQHDGHR